MIQRSALIDALSISIISSTEKGIIPGSQFAVVTSTSGNIEIACSDGQTQAITKLYDDAGETFQATVPAKTLLEAVRGMPEKEVTLSGDAKSLIVSCSKAKVRMSKIPNAGISRFAVDASAPSSSLRFSELLRALKTCIIHAEANKEINVLFDAVVIDNSVARATDGATAVLTKLLSGIVPVKVPLDAARKIAKIDLGDKVVTVRAGENRACVSWDRGEFNFAPFHMNMPDFSGAFPKDHSDREWVRVSCQDVAKMIEFGRRLALNGRVRITGGGGKLCLRGSDASTEIDFEVETIDCGPVAFECQVNPQFMANGLDSITKNGGVAIISKHGDSALYMSDDLQNTRGLVALIGD